MTIDWKKRRPPVIERPEPESYTVDGAPEHDVNWTGPDETMSNALFIVIGDTTLLPVTLHLLKDSHVTSYELAKEHTMLRLPAGDYAMSVTAKDMMPFQQDIHLAAVLTVPEMCTVIPVSRDNRSLPPL